MRNILHAIHHDYQVVTLEKEWG
ncbi:hypothetical protein ROI_28690 [Roseburia intestinalis M50/1]|nr:hypothetical protein ROI_28690 [Roseburia intestinalis M50/1]